MEAARPRPSGWWYAVAAAVVVAGVAGFILLLVSGIASTQKDFQRGVVPGQLELQLDKAGTYTIYYESQSVVDGKVYSTGEQLPPLTVAVAAKATGAKVAVTGSVMSQTYSYGSNSGHAILAFTIDQPGTYILTGSYSGNAKGPEIVLAVGRGFGARLVATIFGGIGILFGSIGIAIAIFVVTLVKRRRAA